MPVHLSSPSPASLRVLRLGLCCQFAEQPIAFRVTTAMALQRLPRDQQLRRLADLALGNAKSFHLSSPLEGWSGPKPERHHDYIDPRDFPSAWRGWRLTVEVEAKAKELAVGRLARDLRT